MGTQCRGSRVLTLVPVELGVVVGKRGRDIPESEAEGYVAGYGS